MRSLKVIAAAFALVALASTASTARPSHKATAPVKAYTSAMSPRLAPALAASPVPICPAVSCPTGLISVN